MAILIIGKGVLSFYAFVVLRSHGTDGSPGPGERRNSQLVKTHIAAEVRLVHML